MINKLFLRFSKWSYGLVKPRLPGLQRRLSNARNVHRVMFRMEGTVIGIVSQIMETSGF
jgi:hypothetical protein